MKLPPALFCLGLALAALVLGACASDSHVVVPPAQPSNSPVATAPVASSAPLVTTAPASTATTPPGATSVPAATPSAVATVLPTPPAIAGAVDFDRQIKPLLVTYCYQCHANGRRSGGVRFDVLASATQQVVPGNPDRSAMYHAITRSINASDHMPPPAQPQPEDEDLALIRQWILEGGRWGATP